MTDVLSTGLSALRSYQTALNTTSNNIANANTAGYSRQRVELTARPAYGTGSGYIGDGVSVSTVSRIADTLVTQRLQTSVTSQARADTYANYASRIDSLMSDSSMGLAAPMQAFFDAANSLAQNPSSTSARQALLTSAQTLTTNFNTLQSEFDSLQNEIDSSLSGNVAELNQYTDALAKLNTQIVNAQAQFGGQPPNDLLDQRDQLVQKIGERIGITTALQDDGSLNVYTGTGQALVVGKDAATLGTAPDAYNSGTLELTWNGQPITNQISGGRIGGLLDARRQLLEPMRNELGRVAAGLADAVNAQNAQGVDSLGRLGTDLLTMPSGSAYASNFNSGNATMTVAIDDVSALDGSDYQLRFDGLGWSATDARSGATVPMTGTGTSGDPLLVGGVAITLSGTASAGDRFLVRLTAGAAGQIGLATNDPARIAAASAVRVSATSGNSAQVSSLAVTDSSDASLLNSVNISFTSATTYQINGSGSYTYTAGSPISVNGWSLSLSGTPAAGDSFAVSRGATNSGDNSNARALAQIGSKNLLAGGSASLMSTQSALTARAGSSAQQANLQLDAQNAALTQATAARESLSGVNLDEEAADMIRFQQAYQAAAQIIQVANEVFQSLLAAARS